MMQEQECHASVVGLVELKHLNKTKKQLTDLGIHQSIIKGSREGTKSAGLRFIKLILWFM